MDDHYRFKEDPSEIFPMRTILKQKKLSITPQQLSKQLELMMKTYRLSLPKERRFIIDQYTIRDIAFKVVGIGSVGTRCWVILLEGGFNQDTLILQIKEANDFVGYCALCARTLAHAHAKTGNRFAIAGYLRKNNCFIQSMAQFYANQSENDYQTFLRTLEKSCNDFATASSLYASKILLAFNTSDTSLTPIICN